MSLPVNPEWLESARLALANVYVEQPCRTLLVACQVCTMPVTGYEHCYKCNEDRNGPYGSDLADLVAPLAYAWDGQSQLGKDVYNYKQANAQLAVGANGRLAALVYTFGTGHERCPERFLGRAVTAKAFVPSLQGNPGTQLARMADRFLPGWPSIPVTAALTIRDSGLRRALDPSHFVVEPQDVPANAHVLVLEDSWIAGGNSQSVAVALKRAGAGMVTVIPICRLLKPGWLHNSRHRESDHPQRWSPTICPVTGSACP